MKLHLPLCVALTAAVSGCAVAPPPPSPSHSPGHVSARALVESNADAARVLAGLRARGLVLAPSDGSQVELLAGSPGFVWKVEHNWLHLHVYPDRAAASAAVARFVAAQKSRGEMIHWVGPPHLFHCGTAVALYLGSTPQDLAVLTALCGPPAYAPIAYPPPARTG